MMKKFIDLLSFEMNRFLKFLVPTFLIVGVIQLFVTFSVISDFKESLEMANLAGGTGSEALVFSIQDITVESLYELSILLIILVFMFYSFFIWYREWLGKNTFIYRLLMLPMNRSYIFLSKAFVFLIGGFLSFVFQFGMYALQLFISNQMIPSEYYTALNIHNAQPVFTVIQGVLFPTTGFQFLANYSFAFAALVTLFAAILIERTYGLKGLMVGVVYFIGFFVLYGLVSSLFYLNGLSILLKPSHTRIIAVGYQFFMILLGSVISHFLLKNRVKV